MLKESKKRKLEAIGNIQFEAKKLCLMGYFARKGAEESVIRQIIHTVEQNTIYGQSEKQRAKLLQYFVEKAMNKIYENNNPTKGLNFTVRNIAVPSTISNRQKAIQAHVANSLKFRGFCVIDKFMGHEMGLLLANETDRFYREGRFKNGSDVGANSSTSIHQRSDKVCWVTDDIQSQYITNLLEFTDGIVTKGAGVTENINETSGTKAMLSVYPGNNSGYKMHVDNAVKDGRRLTCTYYMNPNWNSKENGGSLKLLARTCGKVAKIEPIMDRMLFFYSDYRNPHEVEPCTKNRKSVTFWYFDKSEREAAIKQSVV